MNDPVSAQLTKPARIENKRGRCGLIKKRKIPPQKIVKNTGKNRLHVESFTASEAAALLGVSIPTLKRMVAEGSLESFRTPGGHLRILAESVDTLREPKQERFRPVRDASPVLQNRRER